MQGCEDSWFLIYGGTSGGEKLRFIHAMPNPLALVEPGVSMIVAGCRTLCSFSTHVFPGGFSGSLLLCVLNKLNKHAIITAGLRKRRISDRSVLYMYAERLLRNGVSIERLTGLLATSAGGGASLAAMLVEGREGVSAPSLYAAAYRPLLCFKYSLDGLLLLTITGQSSMPGGVGHEGYRCMRASLLKATLRGNIPRVEVKKLADIVPGKL